MSPPWSTAKPAAPVGRRGCHAGPFDERTYTGAVKIAGQRSLHAKGLVPESNTCQVAGAKPSGCNRTVKLILGAAVRVLFLAMRRLRH
jgi:hypothetical protein